MTDSIEKETRGSFGAFLYQELRSSPNKSAQWLADHVKREGVTLDPSLIRHWTRGSRVPQLGHPAIPKIAKVLGKDEAEVEQKQQDSLKWHEKRRQERKTKRIGQSRKVEPELLAKPEESSDFANNLQIKDCRKELARNAKSCAIKGERNVLETTISLIESLPKVQNQSNKEAPEMLLTIQGKTGLIEKFEDLERRWYNAIKSALNKGWKVSHIVRIDNELERIKRLVSKILQLVGYEGKYELLYFRQKYVLPVAQSFLIVPSCNEGIVFYAGEQAEYVDSAIYIKDKDQIEVLHNHFSRLREEMDEVFYSYSKYPQIVDQLSKADQQPGNRIVILKRLSDIQRPQDYYYRESKWAEAHKASNELTADELDQALEARKKRQENLKEHSINYHCRYIYVGGCLQKFVESGEANPLENYVATLEERLAHLNQLREFLDYPKYEMALAEEEIVLPLGASEQTIQPARFPEIMPEFCEVQDDHLVLMQFWIKGNNGKILNSKWIIIREPIIVRAFYEYLSEKWEEVPDKRRDRFYVLRWLERESEKIERRIAEQDS